MKKGIKFKKVEIQIGDTVTKLSLDEVKELRDILNDAFPVEPAVVREYIPYRFWGRDGWPYTVTYSGYGAYCGSTGAGAAAGTFTGTTQLYSSSNTSDTLKLRLSD